MVHWHRGENRRARRKLNIFSSSKNDSRTDYISMNQRPVEQFGRARRDIGRVVAGDDVLTGKELCAS